MKVYVYCLLAVLLGTALAWGQVEDAPQSRAPAEDGVEVLTRGPVHEAFVGTVTFNPEPGVVAPKAPPDAIEELPPEQKPDGANVAWIPGYWAWDDERNDFLWISGVWRNLPPGRQWVPGYWGQVDEGVQWTSGYWADASASEIEYLAEPPASVEAGPNVAASSPDQIWMPGCWLWQQNRYAWRPGYWSAGQPDWVWVPAYYAWTPRGYVFVDGYYDYSVANRGLLFAPVFFNSSVYARRGFSYSPMMVINPAVFGSQLFLRPNYQHYYFGDYYAASYSNAGYYPWFSYNSKSQYHGYDPIYAHERWQHRQDRAWEQNVQAGFQHRRDNEEARPPRTLVAQNALVKSQGDSVQKGVVIAASLAALAKSQDSPLRLKPVAPDERRKLVQHGQDVHKFRQERQKQEGNVAVTKALDPAKPSESTRIRLPQSPLVSRPTDQLGKNQTPPKRHEVLKPDLDIEPKPRVRTDSRPGTKVEAKAPTVKPDMRKGKPDAPRGKADAPQGKLDAPRGKADAPQGKPDAPRGKADAPRGKADAPRGKPDAPRGKADAPRGKPDAPKGVRAGANRAEPTPKPSQGNPSAGPGPGSEKPRGKGKDK